MIFFSFSKINLTYFFKYLRRFFILFVCCYNICIPKGQLLIDILHAGGTCQRNGADALLLVVRGETQNGVISTEAQACTSPTLSRQWSKYSPQKFRHAEARTRLKGNNPSILSVVFKQLKTHQQVLIMGTITQSQRKNNSFVKRLQSQIERDWTVAHTHRQTLIANPSEPLFLSCQSLHDTTDFLY